MSNDISKNSNHYSTNSTKFGVSNATNQTVLDNNNNNSNTTVENSAPKKVQNMNKVCDYKHKGSCFIVSSKLLKILPSDIARQVSGRDEILKRDVKLRDVVCVYRCQLGDGVFDGKIVVLFFFGQNKKNKDTPLFSYQTTHQTMTTAHLLPKNPTTTTPQPLTTTQNLKSSLLHQ